MQGAVEFEFSRVVALELLAQIPGASAFLALSAQVCPKGDEFFEWEQRIEAVFGDAVRDETKKYVRSRHRGGGLRAACYDAIALQSAGVDDEITNEILTYLRKIEASGLDKPLFPAAARARAISRIEATLSPVKTSKIIKPTTIEADTFEEDEDELEPT